MPDPRSNTQNERAQKNYPQSHNSEEVKRRATIRTWLLLLSMMVVYSIWAGLIYFLEPGIR